MGAGCPITQLLLHCPAALSHQAGTFRVAHGDMWQSSGPGAQPPALDWEPGDSRDTGEPATQLQTSALLREHESTAARPGRTAGPLAPRIPKTREGVGLPYTCLDPGLPPEEQCLGQPQVGAVLELLLQLAGAILVTVCKGVQGKRKVKKKTELTLFWKPQSRKAGSFGVKSSAPWRCR